MIKKIAFVTAMALSVCGSARADGIDPIKMRQTGLDLLAGTFSGIRTAIDAKVDVKKLESAGAAIQRWSTVFPTLFPPGSDKGDTKAAPSIWSDRAGFEKASMALGSAAEVFVTAAKSGDDAAAAAAWKGIGDACGACHKEYRLK